MLRPSGVIILLAFASCSPEPERDAGPDVTVDTAPTPARDTTAADRTPSPDSAAAATTVRSMRFSVWDAANGGFRSVTGTVETDASSSVRAVLVDVLAEATAGERAREIEISAREGGRLLLRDTHTPGVLGASGSFHVPFLLRGERCATLVVRARPLGQDDVEVVDSLAFRCRR